MPAYGAAAGQPMNTGMFTPAGVPSVVPSQAQPQMAQMQAPGEPAGYQPPGAPGMDALGQQMGQMHLSGQNTGQVMPQRMQTGAAPDVPGMPLNQLYNIDLLQQIPPPITDLDLPPPPIILPPKSSVTGSPTANCPLPYMRSTLNAVPTTNSLLKKSKLPFALVIQPYVSLHDSEAPVPVVSDSIICRCRRCRSYINPYVTFTDQGRKWRCNVCNLSNEVPSAFDWDFQNQQQLDRWARPELNHAVVEFVAPPEYMVRPPQPLLYMFLIDCSATAVASGLLATTARTILESLDRIPNKDKRTRVGFLCVNSSLHYFTIPEPPLAQEPAMLVVSDLDEPFLPVPHNLLVPLAECREGIEVLLNKLSDMFVNTVSTSNAMGPALKAAHKLIGNIGGKIICLMASLPNLGIGKLEPRDDKKSASAGAEKALLQTQSSFYKSFAVDCSKSQVSVDMFLFSSQYQDVASLSNLPRYTSGQTYFYPGWNAGRSEDAIKFAHEFSEHLSMEIALEAVLRVRATTGLRMNTFYGNFFTRSSDLCAFPSFPRDQSYCVEVAIDETVTKPFVSLQTAVLHSTCTGERRIRVMTLNIPTTSSLADVYASADQVAIASFLTQRAVERALSHGLQDARDLVGGRLVEMLVTYKKELMTTNVGASAPLQFCANLRLLPLLALALIKHVGLRKSSQIPSDLRSAALDLLSTMPAQYLMQYLHPDMYCLHNMPDEAGRPDKESGALVMPPKMHLSAQHFERHGLYLIDDGQTLFIWVGRDAVPQLTLDVFGLPSLEHVKTGKTTLPVLDNEFSERINAILGKAREKMGSIVWPHLYVVREDGDPSLKLWASTVLIEDRADQGQSYMEFLSGLRERIS
ncbi:protein transport protein SEC24 [Dipodascopsis tothii]|uniref:protein transport protein SEC24 n=1 Tax=Dipodascopsis tothii TaxID=44089 RepID=UPI0034CD5B07